MGKKGKYKTIKVPNKIYHFTLRFGVLLGAVVLGAVVLAYFGHREYETLLGVGGVARALELAGEAAADAWDDYA